MSENEIEQLIERCGVEEWNRRGRWLDLIELGFDCMAALLSFYLEWKRSRRGR